MSKKKIHFLMVARILYDKGYKEYIEASKHFVGKQFDFTILGDVDESYPNHVPIGILKDDISSGYIKHLGYKEDVKPFMNEADCIVLPSYHEGLSRVLMEALALGKPIITTDIPGCRETVMDGINGFLCEVKNSASLIEAITKFSNLNDMQRQEMGKRSRQLAEEVFDINNVLRIYHSITDSI